MIDEITQFIMKNSDLVVSYSKQFISLTKDNPVLGGVIGLYGAGVLGYFTKDLPGRFLSGIKSIINKQFTISIKLNNSDYVFDNFMSWYEKEGFSKKSRTLRAQDRNKGTSTFEIGAGLGDHYFIRNFL